MVGVRPDGFAGCVKLSPCSPRRSVSVEELFVVRYGSKRARVVIALRQSPDWKTQTYADLEQTRQFCRMIGRPENFIIDAVKLWDRSLKVSFYETRQAIKEISLANFRMVRNAALVDVADVAGNVDRKAHYLFTDDDDWYAPHVGEILAGIGTRSCEAILWRSVRYGGGIESRPPDGVFYTNNYAVSGAFLAREWRGRSNLDRSMQHFDANGTFGDRTQPLSERLGYGVVLRSLLQPGYAPVATLQHHLSVTNKHPASTVTLERLGPDPTDAGLRESIEDALRKNRDVALPQDLAWAQAAMDEVNRVLERLL